VSALRLLIVAAGMLALLLLFCANAAAQDFGSTVGNPQRATDGMLYAAVAVADEWWAAQGQYPAPAEVYVYTEREPASVIARAEQPGFRVLFERRYVRSMRRELARSGRRWRMNLLGGLCMSAIHERGHNLGLRHDAGGVMSAFLGDHPVVGRCRSWAVSES
jgi:hypothetical protein